MVARTGQASKLPYMEVILLQKNSERLLQKSSERVWMQFNELELAKDQKEICKQMNNWKCQNRTSG